MKPGKIHLTIVLDRQTVDKLEKRAKDEMRTRSNMASRIVTDELCRLSSRRGMHGE